MRVALENVYGRARLLIRQTAPALWCVVVGEELSEADATALAAEIRGRRKDTAGAFVVRLDSAGLQFTD
jgi:hypothetical protein